MTVALKMSWHTEAKCAGDDLTKYVLDQGPGKVHHALRHRAAARLCEGCPVMSECLSEARRYADHGVVRGGLWLDQQPPAPPRPLSLSA